MTELATINEPILQAYEFNWFVIFVKRETFLGQRVIAVVLLLRPKRVIFKVYDKIVEHLTVCIVFWKNKRFQVVRISFWIGQTIREKACIFRLQLQESDHLVKLAEISEVFGVLKEFLLLSVQNVNDHPALINFFRGDSRF